MLKQRSLVNLLCHVWLIDLGDLLSSEGNRGSVCGVEGHGKGGTERRSGRGSCFWDVIYESRKTKN